MARRVFVMLTVASVSLAMFYTYLDFLQTTKVRQGRIVKKPPSFINGRATPRLMTNDVLIRGAPIPVSDTKAVSSPCDEKIVKNYTIMLPNEKPSDLLTTQQGVSASNYSACQVVSNSLTPHFAHSMQQIYRCFSLLQTQNSSTPRILILPYNVTHYFEGHNSSAYHNFDTGFVYAMADVLKVEIIPSLNSRIREAVRFERAPMESAHNLADPNHVRSFGETILEHHAHGRNKSQSMGSSPSFAAGCHHSVPRIGILNRRKNRKILNVEYLSNALRDSKVSAQFISIQYFEEADFIQQVQFFASIDVLVSPHGAQLTGIPFMPKCGQVLELFTAGYYVPFFYASLSKSVGLIHHSAYVGDEFPIDYSMKLYENRSFARRQNMCPNAKYLVDIVQRMVQARQECCSAAAAAPGSKSGIQIAPRQILSLSKPSLLSWWT